MNIESAKLLSGKDQWFRVWMPYQFIQMPVPTPKHVYLPLNRNYKPLGLSTSDHVDYGGYVDQAVVFARDPRSFKNVWHDAEGLYLYEGGYESKLDYFDRFERLLAHGPRLFSEVMRRRTLA